MLARILAPALAVMLLSGCAETTAPPLTRTTTTPSPSPLKSATAPEIWIRYRRRGSPEEIDDCIGIRRIEGTEKDGARHLTRVVAWSDLEDRERSYAISSIVAIMPDGEDITGRTAIMYWFRQMAGVATDADHEAAGIAASAIEAADSGDPLAIGLRIPAWIRYQDREGAITERQITVTGIEGVHEDDGTPEATAIYAYCHLRRDARTFFVDRIEAIADTADGLHAAEAGMAEAWLLDRARAAKPKRRRRKVDGGHR